MTTLDYSVMPYNTILNFSFCILIYMVVTDQLGNE
jgi:hypothetical protein